MQSMEDRKVCCERRLRGKARLRRTCAVTCVDWEKKKQNCWCRGESGDKSPETPRLDPSMSSHFVADHQSQL